MAFYRAMHMHKRGICRHAVSVCLSRSWVAPKRIKISSKFFHHRVATPDTLQVNSKPILRTGNVFFSGECGWLWKELVVMWVGWLWKEPVNYWSRCSNWRPFAFTYARSRAVHWSTASSTTHWGMLAHVSTRRFFKWIVSRTGVLYRRCCIRPQMW